MNKKYIGDSPRLAVFGGLKKHALMSGTLAICQCCYCFNPTALSAKIVRY